MDDAEKPLRCPCCRRPVAAEITRCGACGTDLIEPAEGEECEWDEAFDADEDWEEDLSPNRGLVIAARVLGGLGAMGIIALFCWTMSQAQSIGDRIGMIVVGAIIGALVLRALKMLYVEA